MDDGLNALWIKLFLFSKTEVTTASTLLLLDQPACASEAFPNRWLTGGAAHARCVGCVQR